MICQVSCDAPGVTTPAVRVLLQVFIGEDIFKCAAMQISG